MSYYDIQLKLNFVLFTRCSAEYLLYRSWLCTFPSQAQLRSSHVINATCQIRRETGSVKDLSTEG